MGRKKSGGIASKLEYVCSATGASQKFGIHRAARIYRNTSRLASVDSFPGERFPLISLHLYKKAVVYNSHSIR